MTETDAPGPRIDAAKVAAHRLLEGLPDGATVALETYGTTTGSAEADKAAGCRDATMLIPLGPLDRPTMSGAVDAIAPSGYTPISFALQTAAAQLPDSSAPQAIVLVSDGEETCDSPPCETATRIKQSRPGLTISTVGFKVDGPAADQLRCIADTTGGMYVQAANAAQLAARLLATQNIDQATSSLSSTGIFGIDIGADKDDVRRLHTDFPDVDRAGEVVVVWRDCDFGFTEGVLTSISPRDGGRTIDGVEPGRPVADARQLYGDPLGVTSNSDGTASLFFDADPHDDNAYRMIVDGYRDAGNESSGVIRSITLCRCKPQPSSTRAGPERVILAPVDSQGNTVGGYLEDASARDTPIDCSYGSPSPYDVTGGVRFCGGTADSGDACWPTAGGSHVLCLTDPFEMKLTLRVADGAGGALEPLTEEPRPMAIELEDGTRCRARIGGSWPGQALHPDYVGHFGCEGGSVQADYLIVWAPADDGHGIVKGPNGWTVQVGGDAGPLTTLAVSRAYFVGVA